MAGGITTAICYCHKGGQFFDRNLWEETEKYFFWELIIVDKQMSSQWVTDVMPSGNMHFLLVSFSFHLFIK